MTKMLFSNRYYILAVVVLIAACFAFPAIYHASGQKTPSDTVVEAKVLVVKSMPSRLGAADKEPDYLPTQAVILRSRIVTQRAVEKGKLAALNSLAKAEDPVAAIQERLTVARDPADGNANVITLAYRGTSAEDGVKILNALMESYDDFLAETYRNAGDHTLALIKGARDTIGNDVVKAEERYRQFRQKFGAASNVEQSITKERILVLERKRIEVLIRQTETRVKLKQAELASAPLGLQLAAHEWAVKFDLDKAPKAVRDLGPVPAYRESLKNTLDHFVMMETELDKLVRTEKAELQRMTERELEAENLRNDILHHQQLFEATMKRLHELSLDRELSGYLTRVISGPKVKK